MGSSKQKFKIYNPTKDQKPLSHNSDRLFQKINKIIKNFKGEISTRKLLTKYNDIFNNLNTAKRSRYLGESIKEKDRFLINGDTYQRVYFLADLPIQLNSGILFKLINLPINLSLS